MSLSLLGRGGFLQVPHFQRVIFRRGDQNRLNGVKRKTADRIEVVSECELGVPRLPQGVFIISDLRKAGNIHKYSTFPLKLIPAVILISIYWLNIYLLRYDYVSVSLTQYT